MLGGVQIQCQEKYVNLLEFCDFVKNSIVMWPDFSPRLRRHLIRGLTVEVMEVGQVITGYVPS